MINDEVGRSQHEIDVVALAAGQRRGTRQPVIRAIGEAKDSAGARTHADLTRLERIRSHLIARGIDATSAKLLLFSRSEFDPRLHDVAAGRRDIELIDLERIRYGD